MCLVSLFKRFWRKTDPSPQHQSLFFAKLPPEIRTQIYAHILEATEQPFFLVSENNVYRCGPSSAFQRQGPPALLRTCRLMAEEASQVLHEVRELRLLVVSPTMIPSGAISRIHKLSSWEEFKGVLRQIQRLTLVITAHPGWSFDVPRLQFLDALCTLLEERGVPPRSLALLFDCCYGDTFGRRSCKEEQYELVRRLQAMKPLYVEHRPWNAKCVWAQVKASPDRWRGSEPFVSSLKDWASIYVAQVVSDKPPKALMPHQLNRDLTRRC